MASAANFFNWYLNTNFVGDMTLSQRITQMDMQDEVVVEIVNNIEAGIQLTSMVKDLQTYTNSEGLPKYMRSIATQAKKVMRDESQYADFVQTLMSEKEELLERLEESDITSASAKLTKAYLKIVDAAENLNENGLDAAIDYAIDKKAVYNAFRIAQTETNRVYNQSVYQNALDDDDVIGMTIKLSQTQDNCDECMDVADEIYDVDSVPETPLHPNCRCFVSPVYRLPEGKDESDIITDYDGDVMQSYEEAEE
jgi:hypothetical protein